MMSNRLKQLAVLIMLSITTLNLTAQHSKGSFKKIFNGKSLKGWKGDSTYWRVENNAIVGETTPETLLKSNTFLIYDNQVGDFELMAEFKISESGNSGIQYRSELVPDHPYTLKGYQGDIDGKNEYTGLNYEERGRGFLAKRGEKVIINDGKEPEVVASLGDGEELKKLIKPGEWNKILLIAKGNKLQHFINGVLMSEVTDDDVANRKFKGLLGLQAHAGPPMKVEYKNIYLK